MSPHELVHNVARVTGETRHEIRRRGFQPVIVPADPTAEDDAEVAVVDWDGAPDVSEAIR